MGEPKLLADEEVSRLREKMSAQGLSWDEANALWGHVAALGKERDAALADNAALWRDVREAHDVMAEAWPGRAIVKVLAATLAVPHPGAALLKEPRTLRERAMTGEEWICPDGHRVSLRSGDRCADCSKEMVSLTPQPMAALLQEHHKALDEAVSKERMYRDQRIKEVEVRASNEGLERAAQWCDGMGYQSSAQAIRAKKEPAS